MNYYNRYNYNRFWFFIAASAAVIPIPLIKIYTETKDIKWIVLSLLSCLLLVYSYSVLLTDKNIIIIYPILKVLSVILVVAVGLVVFMNKLDAKTIMGILLGLASIYLLSDKIYNKK